METRQVTEVKLFFLVLNPMAGNAENSNCLAYSEEKPKLIEWYNRQIVEPYQDDGISHFSGEPTKWHKTFAPGSILEWYNPLFSLDEPNHYGQGIIEKWVPIELFEQNKINYPRI